jgi:hypothetical protein
MDAVSTGYVNYFANPIAATSTPSNFGPGQVSNNDNNQTDDAQTKLRDASSVGQAATGYTTATRGSQLNISV